MNRSLPSLVGTVFLLVALLLGACRGGTDVTQTPAVSTSSPALTSPLSAQESPLTPQLESIPHTPVAGRGVVSGLLIHHILQSPLGQSTLYLAPLLQSNDGRMEVARFDRTVAPMTETGMDGRFVFADVAPGRYGIIFSTAVEDYLLVDSGTDQEVLFDLAEDQVLDLGVIRVEPPES